MRKIVLGMEFLRIDFNGKLITVQPYAFGYDFTHPDEICGWGGYRDYCVFYGEIKKIKVDGKWCKVVKFEKTIFGLEIYV